jgi:glucose-6-phosphate 1-epimerase
LLHNLSSILSLFLQILSKSQLTSINMVERSHRPTHISPIERAPQPIVSISDDNWTVSARLPTGETVEVHLCGATVISWKNANGSENLWLSEKAILDGSKAIRGGIPVVFPVSKRPLNPPYAKEIPQ